MLRGGLYCTIKSCLARRTWGVSHLDVSREHAAGAEPAVANAGRDWKRVCRDLSNIEDVRITLCEPNSELRMSLRMALQGIGFSNLNDGDSLRGVETALELSEADLLSRMSDRDHESRISVHPPRGRLPASAEPSRPRSGSM